MTKFVGATLDFGAVRGQNLLDPTSAQDGATKGYVDSRNASYATTIGDGAATSFTITHNLGTQDVNVFVYRVATPFQQIFPNVYSTSTTTVTVSGFTTAPAANSLRVVVFASGGPVASYVQDTASVAGPPTAGTWSAGQSIVDSTGAIWVCVVGGTFGATPPVFAPGGSGFELDYAELSTDPAAIGVTQAIVPGLAITFTAPLRAVMLEFHIPIWTASVSTVEGVFLIYDGAGAAVAEAWAAPMQSSTNGMPYTLKTHLPRTGTGAYPLTPGTTYAFHVEAVTLSGTIQITTTSGVYRPFLRAVTC